jgi:hypothetical protein
MTSMANRDQCIPEPDRQPSHHPLAPAGWEESAGFRETFLYHFYMPQDVAALRHLSRMLHEMSLEMARYGPVTQESGTHENLRAALADLRHLQGFLAVVGRSQEESALTTSDAELAALAARQSRVLADLAAALEQALG